MRCICLLPFLAGCGFFDQHSTVVRFVDVRAVEVATTAPDGTRARLPPDPAPVEVAAGGGVLREPGSSTRASFAVRALREADGAAVLRWDTGLAMATGNEFEVVNADGDLAVLSGEPAGTVTPRAADPRRFHGHLCIGPERRSSRGSFTGYALAPRVSDPTAYPEGDCPRGIAVDLFTPWTNVALVQDRVTAVAPIFGLLFLLCGAPIAVAGGVFAGEPATRDIGIGFTVVGGLLSLALIPYFFHTSHTDTLHPAPAP